MSHSLLISPTTPPLRPSWVIPSVVIKPICIVFHHYCTTKLFMSEVSALTPSLSEYLLWKEPKIWLQFKKWGTSMPGYTSCLKSKRLSLESKQPMPGESSQTTIFEFSYFYHSKFISSKFCPKCSEPSILPKCIKNHKIWDNEHKR